MCLPVNNETFEERTYGLVGRWIIAIGWVSEMSACRETLGSPTSGDGLRRPQHQTLITQGDKVEPELPCDRQWAALRKRGTQNVFFHFSGQAEPKAGQRVDHAAVCTVGGRVLYEHRQ